MAFPEVPAIAVVSATSSIARVSTQSEGGGNARQYAHTARATKPVAAAHADEDGQGRVDSSRISIEGLQAELQALLGDIRSLAAAKSSDPQTAARLAALVAQVETVSAEIAEAAPQPVRGTA